MHRKMLSGFLAAVVAAVFSIPACAQESESPFKLSAEAIEIHNSGILFDGHNDLPWAMREKASSSFDKVDIANPTEFHTDIPRLRKGGVKAQFWSVYVPAETDFSGNALLQTLEQIEIVTEMCRRYPNDFEMAGTAADDHIEHVVKVAGIDHVGIGSDFDGVTRLPAGLKDVSQYPNITQELLDRGYSREDILKILGGNVIRVLEAAEQVAKQLKAERTNRTAKKLFSINVSAGEHARKDCIVEADIFKAGLKSDSVTLADNDGNQIIGQISGGRIPNVLKPEQRILTFVVPDLNAHETREYSVFDSGLNTHREFKWHDDESTQAELHWGDRSVVKYMYEALDDSTDERRQETYKPYHHVFSPDGSQLLTKGPGGLFPHHRGIYFGFSQISYDGKKADTWHCRKGESQAHVKGGKVAGPVFGRDINEIDWNGQDGKTFAKEIRQITAYKIGTNTLIEFESILTPQGSKIVLDGDPQHAGVQFRATQKVPDSTKEKTYYIRPDGVDKPGNFRNWSNHKDEAEVNKAHKNLPWNAMSFFVDGKQYSCCYLDHLQNPKPAMFSERDYGRFGSYFKYELTPDNPLYVCYRFWLQDGPIEIEKAKQLSIDFNSPVVAIVVEKE